MRIEHTGNTYEIKHASGDRSTHVRVPLRDPRHQEVQARLIADLKALPGVKNARFTDRNALRLDITSTAPGSLDGAHSLIMEYMRGYLGFLSGA